MKKTYYGFNTIDDLTPEQSLKKHGIIVQNFKSDYYYCLYEHDGSYEYGFSSESEIEELISGNSFLTKSEINSFLNEFLDMEESAFKNLPFIYKLNTLMQYFTKNDIMGKKTHYMNLDEALSEFWLHKI